MSNFPKEYDTHGGEDVAIYARGPMSHLFVGTHEETFLAHGMAYAACVGANKKHCESREDNSATASAPAIMVIASVLVLRCFV